MMEQSRLGKSFWGQGLIGGVTVCDLSSWDLDLMADMSWSQSVAVVERKTEQLAVVKRRRR